jgi:TolB-like protein/tetratricopeptide (TPR) repeat protein
MTGIAQRYWRRIVASSAVYAAAGWAAVEALTTVVERFGLPGWLGSLVIAAYVAGLPVTIFLVWRTAGKERRLSFASFAGSMAFLLLATGALFWFTRSPEAEMATVAVLPCAMDADGNAVQRGDGFAEDIHARLSRVDSIRIISWNSSLFVREKGYGPKQVSELLHANRVLECDMRSGGERITVSARLVDPAQDRVLWNRNYDFVAADLGTVVTEISGTVLDVLSTPVQAEEMARVNHLGTFSPEAFDLLLQARSIEKPGVAQRPNNPVSESLVRQALELDPNYAEAMVHLSDIYLYRAVAEEMNDIEQLREWVKEARRLAERALELDPQIWNARHQIARACGLLEGYLGEPCAPGEMERLRLEECEVRGDTAEGWLCRNATAETEEEYDKTLQRWLELEPTSVDANMQYMNDLADHDHPLSDVLGVLETIHFLDPDDKRPFGMLSNILRRYGHLDEVLAWRMGASEDQWPAGFPWQLARLGTDYMNLGLYEEAKRIGLETWETRRASSTHFLPLLLARFGEDKRAAEMVEWMADTVAAASDSSDPWILAASFHAAISRDYLRAKALYEKYLGGADLSTACGDDNDCVVTNALQLHHIEQTLGNEAEAEVWLQTALGHVDHDPATGSPTQQDVFLLTATGRHQEAIRLLREGVFAWTLMGERYDLEFPVYFVDGNAMLDPLRDEPEFQLLLDDYDAHLEPMREQVLKASRSGDWAAIRQQTFEREGIDFH